MSGHGFVDGEKNGNRSNKSTSFNPLCRVMGLLIDENDISYQRILEKCFNPLCRVMGLLIMFMKKDWKELWVLIPCVGSWVC